MQALADIIVLRYLARDCTLTLPLNTEVQPSQNVPAAGHLATYNEISAAYFTLVSLVFRPEALAALASAAYYYGQLAY